MGRVAALWRHPIKSHGREALQSVTLSRGQTMPWDRQWAVLSGNGAFDAEQPEWVPCKNFMIGTHTPGLAGLWSQLDEATGQVILTHATLGTYQFHPDIPDEAAGFFEWIAPLTSTQRPQPARIVAVPGRGMTDSDYPSISIMNTASHRAVEAQLGREFEPERWRGNIWIDGLSAWEEWGWIGKELRIGSASLIVRERIQRCLHTTANPKTGERDVDTLGALKKGWGHHDFGLYAEVVAGGRIDLGDQAEENA